ESTNTAFSCITHPPKASSQRAIDHFIGSQAFIAAGRIGHLRLPEMEKGDDGQMSETGRKLFTHAKHNISIKMPTLAYRIAELTVGQDNDGALITSSHAVWDKEPVDLTADQAIAAMNGRDKEPSATDFLKDNLSEGPLPVATIEE